MWADLPAMWSIKGSESARSINFFILSTNLLPFQTLPLPTPYLVDVII